MHSPSETSDVFANFITNNYANNYYVPDHEIISAGSVEGLSFDEIDEIDTNNMAIYSGDAPVKKERRTGNVIVNTSVASVQPQAQPPVKKERAETKPVKMLQTPKVLPSASKSLLLPNSEAAKVLNTADADLMLNMLGDQAISNQNVAGSSNQMAGTNITPYETAQVSD